MPLTIFLICFGLTVYVYFGYPALLWLFTRGRKEEEAVRPRIWPQVSIIIAAHNEESVIEQKIENTLNQTYPSDRLEVIVASDGSDDRTDDIVRANAERGVRLRQSPARQGKMPAIANAAQSATGDILVFSDANAIYALDAVEQLVAKFGDEQVGCVCGRLVYENRRRTSISHGEQMYWSYENRLKSWESAFNSLIGANGSMYALRRDAFVPLDPDVSDDFGFPLAAYARGYRVVFQPRAMSREEAPETMFTEFKKKRRFVAHQLTTLFRLWPMLRPFRDPKLLFQLISHKLLRNAVPFFLLGMFGASIAMPASYGTPLIAAQAGFYAFAAAGMALHGLSRTIPVFSIPFYFCTVNAAAAFAVFDFLRGKSYAAWNER